MRIEEAGTGGRESVAAQAARFRREMEARWWTAEIGADNRIHDDDELLGRTYSVREQLAREDELERLLQVIASIPEPDGGIGATTWGAAARDRLFEAGARFLRRGLGMTADQAAVLLDPALSDAMLGFVRAARRFDPAISGEDVFQAGRNAATMFSLQLMLGRPVGLTDSILGYSLLYPYSDNLLDDPQVAPAQKAQFNGRFGQRLRGQDVAPASAVERQVFSLVGRIENDWSPAEHPRVFESLQLIHAAQTESVRLGLSSRPAPRRRVGPGRPPASHAMPSPYEVDTLGLSIAKGGASVLADGYLVAGELAETTARFLYGLGTFLQWVDDLQDVDGDRRAGQATLFSQTAEGWPLDGITERLLHFGRDVLGDLDDVGGEAAKPLRELMRRSVGLLVSDAAGRHPSDYSRRYLWRLQDHYPFRFGRLRRLRRQLARRQPALMALAQALAEAG